jgi:hypothetical protein
MRCGRTFGGCGLFVNLDAVFDAIGVRLRSVPFKREKVKAALQSG